jgi:hypothetical protein
MLAAALVGFAVLIGSAASPAEAKRKKVCDPFTGVCKVVDIGGGGGGGGHGSGAGSYPSCSTVASWGDMYHSPDEGKPGQSTRPVKCRNADGKIVTVWSDTAAPLFLTVAPAVLARSLLAEVDLDPIDIGLAPKGADAMALVGLPVWLWVHDPSRTTWGPATISAGGMTMTIKVESLKWSLGDGTTISCGKGTVWKPGTGGKSSPTCGHTYTRQGTYTVTATTHWVARWSGYGQSGEIPFDLSSSRRLTVGEIQVLGTNR